MRNFIYTLIALIIGSSPVFAATKPIKIWVSSQTDKLYYESMILDYQTRVNKDFKAEIQSFGFMQMPDKLAVAIKTGVNPPDIVQIDELFFSMYLGDDIPFLDLTQRFKKSKLKGNIQDERMSLYQWKDKLYGIPQSISACVLYYRVDQFKEHGITEESIDTWQKLAKVGKKLKDDSGVSLVALDWSYFELMLRQRGSSMFKEDGSSNLDTPIAADTLEFIDNLAATGAGLSPDRGSIFDPSFFGGDVMNNEVLSIVGAGWYGLDMLQAYSPEELAGKWRAMPLPAWDDKLSTSKRRTSTFSGQGLVIFKESKSHDAAWKFIDWVMQDTEAAVQRYLQNNSFSAYQPAWKDGRFTQANAFFDGQKIGKLMTTLAKDIPAQRQNPKRVQAVGALRERYWGELMFNERSAKEVILDLHKGLIAPPGDGQGPDQ